MTNELQQPTNCQKLIFERHFLAPGIIFCQAYNIHLFSISHNLEGKMDTLVVLDVTF